MCIEVKTTMTCGHHFISYVCDPKDNHQHQDSSAESPRFRFIYDTCASCDPGASRRVLRLHYEQRHNLLMSFYMKAKRERDQATMDKVEAMMLRSVQTVRRQNFEISLQRSDVEVLWPNPETSQLQQ